MYRIHFHVEDLPLVFSFIRTNFSFRIGIKNLNQTRREDVETVREKDELKCRKCARCLKGEKTRVIVNEIAAPLHSTFAMKFILQNLN